MNVGTNSLLITARLLLLIFLISMCTSVLATSSTTTPTTIRELLSSPAALPTPPLEWSSPSLADRPTFPAHRHRRRTKRSPKGGARGGRGGGTAGGIARPGSSRAVGIGRHATTPFVSVAAPTAVSATTAGVLLPFCLLASLILGFNIHVT